MADISALTAALADRYRIERELGQGGMATVYLARDLKHDRDVASLPTFCRGVTPRSAIATLHFDGSTEVSKIEALG